MKVGFGKNKIAPFITFGFLVILGVGFIIRQNKPNKNSNSFWLADKNINGWQIGNLSFKKEEKRWWIRDGIQKSPADFETVETMLSQLKNLRLDSLVSENPQNFGSYGIDSSSLMVRVNNQELKIGKLERSYTKTYIESEEKIYEADVVWDKDVLDKFDNWKVKNITNLPIFQVTKVTAIFGNNKKVWEPSSGKWEKGNAVETAAHLQCKGYLENIPEGVNENMIISIEAEGQENTLIVNKTIGKKKSETYWASLNQKENYLIDKKDWDNLKQLVM